MNGLFPNKSQIVDKGAILESPNLSKSKCLLWLRWQRLVSPNADISGEASNPKNENTIPEEDNIDILKNIDKDEEEEDPEELIRRQEELLEEFLE